MEYIWDLLVNLHWGAVGQIIMIDILLGGDNAVVIAMACRNLPHEQRAKGNFLGHSGGHRTSGCAHHFRGNAS